ncbi:MAG: hypothetical protein AB1Z23_09660 [Eubacteriales bacterium]
MNKYIIAVGGTGIKCLESFLYINAVNGLEHEEEINYEVLIIDSDENGNYKALQESAIGYKRLREVFRDNEKSMGQRPFANAFATKKDDDRLNNWRIVKDPSETNISRLAPQDEKVKGLLEVLYEPGYKGELDMTLENGVHGKPKVGSLVVEYFLGKEKGDDKSEWGKFMSKLDADIAKCSEKEPLEIVIMGSVFGGTGASGLRTIANNIIGHTTILKNNDDKFVCKDLIERDQMKISVLMMLPYFEIPNNLELTEDEYGLTDINSNTAYALDYYKQDEDFMRKITTIVIGKSNYDEVKDVFSISKDKEDDYAEGGEAQKNRALIPELLAALAMDSFFIGRMKKNKLYYLARDTEQDYKIQWKGMPNPPNYLPMLLNMIVFSLIYRKKIYPVIGANNRRVAEYPWLGICIGDMNKKEFHEDAEKVYAFTENFLQWVINISSCSVEFDDINEKYELVDTDFVRKAYCNRDFIEEFMSMNKLVYQHDASKLNWANIHDEINKSGIKIAKKVAKKQKTENSLDLLLSTLYSTIQKLN